MVAELRYRRQGGKAGGGGCRGEGGKGEGGGVVEGTWGRRVMP